jgi:glutaminyl-peptide cyclotransferase
MENLLLLRLRWQLYLAFLVVLFMAPNSHQAATIDRRELMPLSSDDIAKLVTIKDPLKNLDPSNPASHLSKILIPRARMC